MKDRFEEEEEEEELVLFPYSGSNGIFIYCKSCGTEFEETAGGYYLPIKYESDKFNRRCKSCLIYL